MLRGQQIYEVFWQQTSFLKLDLNNTAERKIARAPDDAGTGMNRIKIYPAAEIHHRPTPNLSL
jgi:hypothetical protein